MPNSYRIKRQGYPNYEARIRCHALHRKAFRRLITFPEAAHKISAAAMPAESVGNAVGGFTNSNGDPTASLSMRDNLTIFQPTPESLKGATVWPWPGWKPFRLATAELPASMM